MSLSLPPPAIQPSYFFQKMSVADEIPPTLAPSKLLARNLQEFLRPVGHSIVLSRVLCAAQEAISRLKDVTLGPAFFVSPVVRPRAYPAQWLWQRPKAKHHPDRSGNRPHRVIGPIMEPVSFTPPLHKGRIADEKKVEASCI